MKAETNESYHQILSSILTSGRLAHPVDPLVLGPFLDWARIHRLIPILASLLPSDHSWQSKIGRDLAQAWGSHQSREQLLSQLCNGPEDIDWVLFKGLGTAYSQALFAEPWQRLTGDVDLLVPHHQLPRAIEAAATLGFKSYGPNQNRRKANEHVGYNHPMVHPDHGVLEIHFRLWGDVALDFVAEALQRAHTLGGHLPRLKIISVVDLFIFTSTHFWLSSQKIHWIWLYELWRFAQSLSAEQWQECLATTAKYGLQVYVLGGLLAWKTLWNLPINGRLLHFQEQLEIMLSPLERLSLRWGFARKSDRMRHLPLLMARRLSGRPTRDAWLGLSRNKK